MGWDRAVGAAGLAVCAALLAGCTSATPAEPAPPGSPASEPGRGGTLRIQLERPASLDPLDAASVYDSLPVNQLFDGLVSTDAGLNLVPALATTWTVSRDSRTYTFHLRQGVRFHDGSPLTPEDVRFTFERLLSERGRDSLAAPYLRLIRGAESFAAGKAKRLAGIEIVDRRTVRIQLERPYLSFLDVLAMDGARIVPEHVVASLGDAGFARSPVGTGPFRLASWDRRGMLLERNAAYFGTPAWLDTLAVVFPTSDSGDEAAEAFFAGRIDVAELSGDHLERVQANRDFRVHRVQELSVSFLGLLTGVPPLDVLEVRQAVAHAIDRGALVEQGNGARREATGILPPGLPGYSPARKVLAHDPDRARDLLAKAGFPGGRGLPPVRLYTSGKSAASTRVHDSLRRDLAAVGIVLDVRAVPWQDMTRRLEDHAAPSFMLGWVADLADPDAFLRTLFESGGSANLFDFADPEADALLGDGARETNPVRRVRIYRQAERRILEQAPLVPLYHSVAVLATGRRVHGFEAGPMGISNVEFQKVWLDAGEAR
jgi:oligopeptide transport system substrate-binding protein